MLEYFKHGWIKNGILWYWIDDHNLVTLPIDFTNERDCK